jgi:hypothetical protein
LGLIEPIDGLVTRQKALDSMGKLDNPMFGNVAPGAPREQSRYARILIFV